MIEKTLFEKRNLIVDNIYAGIKADYVLMDIWFTTEPAIKEIFTAVIDTIGMAK